MQTVLRRLEFESLAAWSRCYLLVDKSVLCPLALPRVQLFKQIVLLEGRLGLTEGGMDILSCALRGHNFQVPASRLELLHWHGKMRYIFATSIRLLLLVR